MLVVEPLMCCCSHNTIIVSMTNMSCSVASWEESFVNLLFHIDTDAIFYFVTCCSFIFLQLQIMSWESCPQPFACWQIGQVIFRSRLISKFLASVPCHEEWLCPTGNIVGKLDACLCNCRLCVLFGLIFYLLHCNFLNALWGGYRLGGPEGGVHDQAAEEDSYLHLKKKICLSLFLKPRQNICHFIK